MDAGNRQRAEQHARTAGGAQLEIEVLPGLAGNVMRTHMKRTTLILDSALHAELRRRAATEGRTLTEVTERTLRLGLEAHGQPRRARVQLPSYDLGPFLADPARRDVLPGRPPGEED